MFQNPLVSIVIPNWNGQEYLQTCLTALLRQTYTNIEVLVVDNASADNSVQYIKEHFSWVRLIELPENRGFTGATNAGIRASTGEVVALLNNDTEADANWVALLVQALAENPDAGSAVGKIYLFDRRDTFHAAGDAFGSNGLPRNRGVWQVDVGQFDHDRFVFGGCGGAVAYRRQVLEVVGLLDEDFFFSLEDVDLNWRAQLAGFRCVFVPRARVYHHLSATGGGETASYYVGRNTLLVLAQTVPDIIWQQHFGAIVAQQGQIAWQALRAWRGKAARARLRGQLAGLLALPRALTKRRKIQALRQVPPTYLLDLLEDEN